MVLGLVRVVDDNDDAPVVARSVVFIISGTVFFCIVTTEFRIPIVLHERKIYKS